MKKIFYPMFGLAALAMTSTSCSDEIENGAVNSNEAVVSFNVQLDNKVGSRTVGDGLTATELHYAVYKADKNAEDGLTIGDEIEALRGTGTKVIVDHKAEVKFTLVKGQTYNFLFWAQCPDGYRYYTVNYETGIIDVNYGDYEGTDEDESLANNENRDAFFKMEKDLKIDGPIEKTITLKRPFSQINVGTQIGSLKDAQTAEVWIQKSNFTIKDAATKLNAYTGAATDKKAVTYKLNDIIEDLTDVNDGEGDLKNVDDKNYEYLAMNYILVADEGNSQVTPAILPGEGKQLINGTFEIFGSQSADGEVDATPINTFEIPNIPVQRNWRTNIIGDILNETVTFNIVIDPNFDNDHNYYTEKELAYAFASGGEVTLDDDVTIDAPFYLDENNKVIKEKTIVVNLNGKTLTYTGNDIMARLGEGSTVTFNGPGAVKSSHYIASANEGGTIIVNGGDYSGNTSTLFQANGGKVYIKGGTFENTDAEYGATYLLNHIDSKKNDGLIEVTGGTFTGFNPAASTSENPVMNFLKYGYKATSTAEGVYTVEEDDLEMAAMNGGTFQLAADVNLVRPLVVTKDLVLDLNGKTLENKTVVDDDCTVLQVEKGATLTIKGNGKVHSTGTAGWAMAVWANGGVVNIENGDFYNTGKENEGADLIYASNNGKIYVAGGSFKSEHAATHLAEDTYGNKYALLNCKGAEGQNNIIEVTGGTFYKFNPANNTADGAGTNYVVDGYASTQDGDNWVVTVKEATDGETVTLSTNGIITNSIWVKNGGTLDGNGYTLAQSETPETNYLVHTNGAATIKNLNIVGGKAWNDNGTYKGPRAIMIETLDGDVVIENVETSGVCYPLNVNASSAKSISNLIVKNSVLRGWTSYGSGLTSALFSNVKFEAGSFITGDNNEVVTYAYCRPYVATRFDGCAFEAGFKIDGYHTSEEKTYTPEIIIKNCTLGGVKITKDNVKDLFDAEEEGNDIIVTVIQ